MDEIVVDASLAAAFALPAEARHDKARALIAALAKQNARLVAPPIFESEADSIIRRHVFLKTLDESAGAAALAVMDALQVEIVYDPATRLRAREMARETNQIRVYDSTYAALAEARGVELWTADERFFNSVGSTLRFVKFIGNYGD